MINSYAKWVAKVWKINTFSGTRDSNNKIAVSERNKYTSHKYSIYHTKHVFLLFGVVNIITTHTNLIWSNWSTNCSSSDLLCILNNATSYLVFQFRVFLANLIVAWNVIIISNYIFLCKLLLCGTMELLRSRIKQICCQYVV